ncbi:MFS transporter [uncultured Lactobacillus sp.]|uniref:MFS transporter n=1 Tax=uncultured Lactobacillus sp. TaxID=153152 RepID=UPI00272B06E0|nr:MFS transporter [uncultured Lactobacillus sp.]
MNEYLKNIKYRTLLNSDLIDSIGNSLYDIVFVIYASTVPNKSLAVSLASMATIVPALLSVIIGVWADRASKKVNYMILTRLSQALLFMALAFLIGLNKSFGLFLVLLLINIISDILGNFGNGLSLPLLQHSVAEKDLNSAMGLYTASNTTIQLIFQAIGATLIVGFNYNYPLFGLINAVTFSLAGLIIFAHRQQLQVAESQIKSLNTDNAESNSSIKNSFNLLTRKKRLLIIIILAVGINFLGAAMIPLINVSLLKYKALYFFNYGYTVAGINILFSVGTILGALFVNDFFKKSSIESLLSYCSLSLLLAIVLIRHTSFWLLAIIILITGYLAGKINPRLSALIMTIVPDTQLASTNGLFQMLVLIGAPIGQVLFLGIANGFSPLYSWILFSILAVVLVIITSFFKVKLKRSISLSVDE